MENETSEMIVKRVSVPIGLEELMEGLSKEVLLKKPDDLYEFAARYFSKLLLLRDKTNYKVKTVRSAQTVTEQNRRLTRAPYGTAPKTLSRQFSIRDHSKTRGSQPRHPHNENAKRHINPQNDTSLPSKRDPSKTSKNEGTEQGPTKKIGDTTEQFEPSVNKVSLSNRRPKRRYDSKRSLSRDKNESQSKGIKSSNGSVSESADTIERTEMIPKRRESNSSTLSNVPSIESSEAKFNTDSPVKPLKDSVNEISPINTPRDDTSTGKANISKRDVNASKSSREDKAEALSGTKSIRDGKVANKSTSKVSPRSESSKCDTQMTSGSEGRSSKATSRRSPSKDSSKTKSLKDEHVHDHSSSNDTGGGTHTRNDLPVTSKSGGAKQTTNKNSLIDTSTSDQSTGKDRRKKEDLKSDNLKGSEDSKTAAKHSTTDDISKAVDSRSEEASNNKPKNEFSEMSTKVGGNVKSEKDSPKHIPSASESQKGLHIDASLNSDSAEKSKNNNVKSKSPDNEDKSSSDSIQNKSDIKSASNELLDQNNRKPSHKNSESKDHESSKLHSKKSTTKDGEKKRNQTTPEGQTESPSYKPSEDNDQKNSIPVPGAHSEKLLTGESEKSINKGYGSKEAAKQNSVGGNSETSQIEAHESSDTKTLQKEESKSISLTKQDNQKDCTSLTESWSNISIDSKKSSRESNNKIIEESSRKQKPSANKSSSEGGLGVRGCTAQGGTLEDQLLSDGSSRKHDQAETDSSSKSENRSPQRDQDERKSDRKDTHVSYELVKDKYPDKDKSSSDKTLPLDESSKIDQNDIKLSSHIKPKEGTVEDADKDTFKSCHSNSKETSKSDEPIEKGSYVENEHRLKQNTKSTSNGNDTVTQPGGTQMSDSKNEGDLRSSDAMRDEKRPVKSSENSTEGKSECGNQSGMTKSNEKSVCSEPPFEDAKNRSMHSATSDLQIDKSEEHGGNRSSLEKNSEGTSTAEKQLESLKLKPAESESNRDLLTNDKDKNLRSHQMSGNGSSEISSSKVEKVRLSSSKEKLASLDSLDSVLSLQNEKKDITKQSSKEKTEDVKSPMPLSTKVSTLDASTTELSNGDLRKDGQSKETDAEGKSTLGNREMEPNANSTKSSGAVEPKDFKQVHNSQDASKLKAGGSGMDTDPKKSKIETGDAKVAEDMTVPLTGKAIHDKSPKMKSGEDSSHLNIKEIPEKIETQMEPPQRMEHGTESSFSSIKNMESKPEVTDPKVALNISSNDKKGNETALTNLDPSSDIQQSLANRSDKIQKDEPSHTVEDYSIKSSSNEVKNCTTESSRETMSDPNQPMSVIDTKPDKSYKEQNSDGGSSKSRGNKDEEANRFIIDANVANSLLNTSGQKETTEKADRIGKQDSEVGTETANKSRGDSCKAGDKNKTDKPRERSIEMQAPTVSDISIRKEITDSSKNVTKVDGMLNLPPNSSGKTDRTEEGMDKNATTVPDKVANVNSNLTESKRAVSATAGYEPKSTNLAGGNGPTQTNIETKQHRETATDTSGKSNNKAYVVDKDVDSAPKSSNNDASKDSTVSREPLLITSGSLKSDDKKQKSSNEINQVGLLKEDAKQKSARETLSSTKAASKEKLKNSHKSASLEIGDKRASPDRKRSGSSSIKSRSKDSPRTDNDLPANDAAKKSTINLRDNGDKLSTSKIGESGVSSKNGHISAEKLSLSENQQKNSKDSTGNSSKSSAGSSKVSSNETQSVDSGNNSLTTSSSEKEETEERSNAIESQSHEKQKLSGSHKRALHRSPKIEERSSKSLSSSEGSSNNNGDQIKPTVSREIPRSTEEVQRMGEQPKNAEVVKEPVHSDVSKEKGFVADKGEKSSEDANKKPIPSVSVEKEINDKAKASVEAQSGKLSQNAPPNTMPKKSSSEGCEKGNSLDISENGFSSKASKIPIRISNVDSPRANGSENANVVSTTSNANLLTVDNLELDKDESRKMKQELEETNVRPLSHHERNDPGGMNEEDRLILEKLNISHIDIEKNNGVNSSKQVVDPTRSSMNSNNVGVNAVSLHQTSNDVEDGQSTTTSENRGSTEAGEQKTGNDVIAETKKVTGHDQSGSHEESSQLAIDRGNELKDDSMQEIPSDQVHTKNVSESTEAEASSVKQNEYMQNHLISKRATEKYDGEVSSMNKADEKDGTENMIHLTLQHKEKLHPDVKSFISQFIEKEQASVYKEHCLCREVKLHDDEEGSGTSSEEQRQVVNTYKAESSNSDKPSSRPSTEKDDTSNKQQEMDSGVQAKTDLVGLTLRHKDGLHPGVKGLINNFIEQEQAHVYKEHCSCREVRLHDTTDESGQNDDEQLSSDADKHSTIIQKQRSEETTNVVDHNVIKRGQSVDSSRPNGYLNHKIPTAEVKGIQALTVQNRNGNYINKSNENSEGSSRFDIAKLREELERVQGESKMNTFHNSYNPYKLKQELKQYSSQTETVSDRNNNTHKTFSAANAVLKIQSMWRGFLVRKVLKRGEMLEKSNSPSNGMLKSGTEQSMRSSATVIANGGHKIPKDTEMSDAPIEGSQVEVSEKTANSLEARISSQTSSDGPDQSTVASAASNTCKAGKQDELVKQPQATSIAVLKTESEHKSDQEIKICKAETANGGQKIPKDAKAFDTANETSKNLRQRDGDSSNSTEKNENLKVQTSSKAFSNGSDKPPEVVTALPGSQASTSERGEELIKHSQVISYGVLEAEAAHRSDQNSRSSETLIVTDGQKLIPKDTQMAVGQSGEASSRGLDNRSSESSLDHHSSGTVLYGGLKIPKDTRMAEASSHSNLKDPPQQNNDDSKKPDGDVSNLEAQEFHKTLSSEAVDNLLGSEATKEDVKELEKAATSLQSMWRGFKARKESNVENSKVEEHSVRRKRKIEDKDMRKVSSISKEDAAALKIQSIWKAYVARKGTDRFKDTLMTKNKEKHLYDVNAAATKIQAHVRGHLLRKKVDHDKRSSEDTKEYRPTSIDSNDSAVTVIYRGLFNNDDYDSLNYDAAIDHVAHMPLLKDEGSITDYQNKLLAQISGKSEETSQKEEAETKPPKDTEQPEVVPTEGRKKTVTKAVDRDTIGTTTTSKGSSIDTEQRPVSTIHDATVPQKPKAGHETANDIKAIEQKASGARPQTRRGRAENEEDKSVQSAVIEKPVTTKVAVAKTEDSEGASYADMEGASLKAAIGQKDQEPTNSHDTGVKEVEVAVKQSYVTTKRESDGSDGLRNTGEFHDVVTIPDVQPNEKEDSDVGIRNNMQTDSSSSIAVSKKGSQVPSKNPEPQENEQPDEENSSSVQCSESGLEKTYLHHSSEMHDVILFPVGSEAGDSQKIECKGTKPGNDKPLEGGGNGVEGLSHSSEYHDLIVFPLESDSRGGDVTSDSVSEVNETKGDSQQDVAREDAKSEEVSAEAGQKREKSPSTDNKDLDGVSESDFRSSPVGLRHTSELHDAVILPRMPHREDATGKNKDVSKNCGVPAEAAKSAQNTLSRFIAAPSRSMETKPPVSVGESQNDMRSPTEVQAATKIQAGFRGYKVRKQLKQKNECPEGDKQRRSSRPKNNNQAPKEIEEQSAVKIQAGIRGFLVRRRQKKQSDITA